MIRKYVLPLLSLAGAIFAVWMVVQAAKPVVPAKAVAEPPRPEFARKISGAGIVEASSRNIAIGTHVGGIVDRVLVKVGQRVKPGDPLFHIDDRAQRAELAVREAAVIEAEAALLDLRAQLAVAEAVGDPRAISTDDLNRRRYAVQTAEARRASASAAVDAARVEIARLTVRAPLRAEILQVNVRPGEFAPTGVTPDPLVLLGSLDRFNVRVDIDENDSWRFRAGAPAVGFVRGNSNLKTDLKFEYIEQFVVPKRSLTGDSTERVDTRVMQVIYSFARGNLPVHTGQQMDVFIEDLSQPAPPPPANTPKEGGR